MNKFLTFLKDKKNIQVIVLGFSIFFLILSFIGLFTLGNNKKLNSVVIKYNSEDKTQNVEAPKEDPTEEEKENNNSETENEEQPENNNISKVVCSKISSNLELSKIFANNENVKGNYNLEEKVEAEYTEGSIKMNFIITRKYVLIEDNILNKFQESEILESIDNDSKKNAEEAGALYESQKKDNVLEYAVKGDYMVFNKYTKKSLPTIAEFKNSYVPDGYTCE